MSGEGVERYFDVTVARTRPVYGSGASWVDESNQPKLSIFLPRGLTMYSGMVRETCCLFVVAFLATGGIYRYYNAAAAAS